jgi:uncharacterized membrane protein YraQ (UPF0718 family)
VSVSSDGQAVTWGRDQTRGAFTSATILLATVLALVFYKTGSALRTLRHATATGSLVASADFFHAARGSTWLDLTLRTSQYLSIIWPALLFGLCVAGAVRTFVSPAWIGRLFAGAPVRQQLAASVAGAPLMLCSCCVAPVFAAVRERSGRLGPSLAVALAAPSLNPAALALTFMLFAPRIAFVRLAMALTAVLGVAPAIARVLSPKMIPQTTLAESPECRSFAACVLQFMVSTSRIALRTVPVLVLGAIAAMWIANHLPASALASTRPEVATAVTAIVIVPVALPTFFEIPLALTLLAAGAPAGAAVATLIAGPAVNMPSLLTIGRSAGWRVAAALAMAVAAVACLGGLLVG